MDLIVHAASHLLETCFFAGLAGAACVVLLTAYGDFAELFQRDDEQA